MTRIFGWQEDTSGCGHYRIQVPLKALASRGFDATYGRVLPLDVLHDSTADVIVAQRLADPGSTRTWQHLAEHSDSMLVLDLDDDMWNIEAHNEPAFSVYNQQALRDLERNIAAAHLVTVSTATLAEVASKFNSNVAVVPNCVDSWMLDHQPPVTNDLLTVGWAGGYSHLKDWDECAPAVKRFVDRNPDVELHTIGAYFTARPNRARHSNWLPGVEDYLRYIDFDIGLAPLRPGVFNRSKSDLRVRELGALGIPVIASDFGPYADTVAHGETGWLVKYPHDWTTALRALADPDTRAAMSIAARQVARGWTIDHNLHHWLDAYNLNHHGNNHDRAEDSPDAHVAAHLLQ
ncbi:glycosyltransferase family 4 protein [Kutzneria albida]|uniref:Uncharacterized protein n=1 Tax=Kutzneria albida DSM 43870 TaxID=1449976 RepID=W5WAZ8_9PSEU|nr:glycosyltransferase family 4 protein [Kutzneria albida]AHH98313.1 hypothetical protein KALB_4951 [Kutzneria albida DSM 43870]